MKPFFECASLGRLAVKGKEESQEAYSLLRAREVETRIEASIARGLTRFVGRGKEMEVLREAFHKASSGSGQVVGIVGEAGVGKSRILLELRTMLPSGIYTYLEGRCLHYGGTMPYLPLLDILKSYFEIQEVGREVLGRLRVRPGISTWIPRGPSGSHEKQKCLLRYDRQRRSCFLITDFRGAITVILV